MSSTKADFEAMRQGSVTAIEVTDAHGRRRTIDVGELNEADLALAERFGYVQVMKREFGYLSAFSFAVSISGLFSTVTTTFYYPLVAGGLASAVWCWLIAGIGCMCIALSVAELVSAYPTCGGLYYTVSRLAPARWSPSISWFVGWINLLGQIAGVASSEYGAAQMLLAAASIGSGATPTGFNYSPTAGHTVAVMAGLTVICGLVNSLSTYWMEKMTKTYVIFHVAVLVSCCIALLVVTPNKNSASVVFTYVADEPESGWAPKGWSFIFGFLSVAWTMTDYAHITEEIREPELKAPWAISMAMLFTYVAGFLFNIVLAFCAGDPNELLSSALGQPVAQLYYNSLGPTGGIVFTVFAFIIIQFVCWTAMQSLARTVFAFSRDNLLPFSRVWTVISPLTQTPLYAVWFSTFWCIAINLIGLGSYTAIVGVFNITAIALDWSYIIPIICKMIWGKFEPGPWNLGKFSYAVNLWATIWTAFVTIIFIMPNILPVTPENMNYALIFLAFILLVATAWWYIHGKRVYTGPIAQAFGEASGEPLPGAVLEKRGLENDSNGSQDLERKH